jgi:hypothetical protein
MAVTKCPHIRSILLTASLAALASFCGGTSYADSGKPAFQFNLESLGGRISKFTGRTDHAVDVVSDGTIWTIFPVQNSEGLHPRGTSTLPGYGFLHLSRSGDQISNCTWHSPGDSSVKDFFPRSGNGFVVRTSSSLISLSSECKERSAIPSPGPGVEVTADGEHLVLATDNGLQVFDADSLSKVGSISFPASLQHSHRAIVWNHLVLIRETAASPCYWAQWAASSMDQPSAWHAVPCPQETMAAFGDNRIIVSNWTAPSPNVSLYKLDGSLLYSFPVPASMRTDTSMFPSDSCLSPDSGRAGIFLFDRKRTWLGQEKVTGEHLGVIDFEKGQTLLSLPVSDSDALLNCSLSEDGKTIAVLRGLNLSVFGLP